MEDSEPHARSGHPETNGSSEQQWPGQNEDLSSQNTFTFLRRTDGQASSPATPSDHPDDVDASSANGLDDEDRDSTPVSQPRIHPRFSRTFSMPQLGRLQNPHRRQNSKMRPNGASEPATPGSYQFYELSLELADMVQMAIQTLLQLSPPQVLDPTREQFSACALSVPTPSMSAMFTAMRNLNYFSANMAAFCTDDPPDLDSMDPSPLIAHTDFDLGELLQSVGDVMSGAAAAADVDLVLYHGDLSLKYAWVSGSESGITVALSHVLRQIMAVAQPGDSIEVGLFIGFAPAPGQKITISDDLVTADALTSIPSTGDGPIHCTIQIAHKFTASNFYASNDQSRPEPHFSGLILQRLLSQIGGSLTHDLPSSTAGRTCELLLTLDRASSSPQSPSTPEPSVMEPTLEELTAFAETLKGAKVALYASSKGSFAQHVTRYLADWGMDVSHMSSDGDPDGEGSSIPSSPTIPSTPAYPPVGETIIPHGASVKPEAPKPSGAQRISFVFIDDDVAVLKERLNALRVEPPYQLTLNPKRPPLPHHSRRSTTQVPQVTRMMSPMPPTSSVVIVHFTSLANFKIVKDVLQTVLSSYVGTSAPMPEVMIVPKPAGPQRVLTQLHMAVTRPDVDPFFSPIATSPATPGSTSLFQSFTGHPSNRSPASNRPPSARNNSDRSNRSTKDILERATFPPPSPLGMSNSTEYFSEDAVQLGSTPSSGLLISSPPGQPAGIFFSPRAKTPRKSSFGPAMERDNGQLVLPPSSRRTSVSRMPSDSPTFSTLHEVASVPRPSRALAIGISQSPTETTFQEPVTPAITTDLSETTQQPISPSSSPTSSPTFRRPTRRRQATQDTKILEKTKAAPDIDIVPPISVLIVEDNVVNQMQLAGFMRKKKLKFQVANNGLEAVEKWKTGNFDLILMDIQMPVMDGIDATKEIRRLEKLNAADGYPPPSPTVPDSANSLSVSPYTSTGASPYRSSVIIVAQTASSLNTDRVKALAAGCNDFLTKPVNHHWLNNKVTEWGSIKALQMWADIPPPPGVLGTGVHPRRIADQLHVPQGSQKSTAPKGSGTSPTPSAPSTAGVPSSALNSSVLSSSSSAFWSPAMPSPPTFGALWAATGASEPVRDAVTAPRVVNTNYPDSPPPAEDGKSSESTTDAPQDTPPEVHSEPAASGVIPVQ